MPRSAWSYSVSRMGTLIMLAVGKTVSALISALAPVGRCRT